MQIRYTHKLSVASPATIKITTTLECVNVIYFSRNRSIQTTKKYLYKTTLEEEHALRFFGSSGGESQSFSVPTEGRVSPIKILHNSPSG